MVVLVVAGLAGLALEKFALLAKHAGRDAFPVFPSSSPWQR